METIYKTPVHKVSPDYVYIPEWEYDLKYNDKDAVTIAFNEKTLLLTLLKHGQTKMGSGFFARFWTGPKIFTWWYNSDYNPYVTIWKIIDRISCSAGCTIDVDMSIVGNLADYTVVFSRDAETIVRTPIRELKYNSVACGYNNTRERIFHLKSPREKYNMEKKNASIREWRHQQYIESCKVWTSRIGSIDVAEYHLNSTIPN